MEVKKVDSYSHSTSRSHSFSYGSGRSSVGVRDKIPVSDFEPAGCSNGSSCLATRSYRYLTNFVDTLASLITTLWY